MKIGKVKIFLLLILIFGFLHLVSTLKNCDKCLKDKKTCIASASIHPSFSFHCNNCSDYTKLSPTCLLNDVCMSACSDGFLCVAVYYTDTPVKKCIPSTIKDIGSFIQQPTSQTEDKKNNNKNNNNNNNNNNKIGLAQTDPCSTSPCKNSGVCHVVDGGGFKCYCTAQWKGPTCEEDVDECSILTVCLNGGMCRNLVGNYYCVCKNGFEGNACEIEIDECRDSPCLNGGTCEDKIGGYECQCSPDKTGLKCHLDNSCYLEKPCHPSAVCNVSPYDGSFSCSCDSGWEGKLCDEDIDECSLGLTACFQGGTCVNTPGSFTCSCPAGSYGSRCEFDVNYCHSNPCLNQSTCLSYPYGFKCLCFEGMTGKRCDERLEGWCDKSMCNGGECVVGDNNNNNGGDGNDFKCICPQDTTGKFCEFDLQGNCLSNKCDDNNNNNNNNGNNNNIKTTTTTILTTLLNPCHSNPCLNNGDCLPNNQNNNNNTNNNNFSCYCAKGYEGAKCERKIELEIKCYHDDGNNNNNNQAIHCQNGGKCVQNSGICNCGRGYGGKECEVVKLPVCADVTCVYKAGNGVCDATCNNVDCGMDGGDCEAKQQDLYADCVIKYTHLSSQSPSSSSSSSSSPCSALYNNGECNEECNLEACYYDGVDCKGTNLCPIHQYCSSRYEDGVCDEACFNAACNHDGTDCYIKESIPRRSMDGKLLVLLPMEVEEVVVVLNEFLSNLTVFLDCTVEVSKRFVLRNVGSGGEEGDVADDEDSGLEIFATPKGTELHIKLDYSLKTSQCFSNMKKAADFLKNAVDKKGAYPGKYPFSLPISNVLSLPSSKPPPYTPTFPNTSIIIGVMFGIIFVVLFVLVGVRKRTTIKTWFPSGFVHTSLDADNRTSSDTQSDKVENLTDACSSESFYPNMNSSIKSTSTLCLPQESNNNSNNFNNNNNNNVNNNKNFNNKKNNNSEYFPVNSSFYSSLTNGNTYRNNFNNINPFSTNMGMPFPQDNGLVQESIKNFPRTGETPLHLAARYNRVDSAIRFLEGGADPNMQDHAGLTPLHTAIGADAVAVFQVLISCKTCSLNVQSKDGATPLIQAVSIAIEGMVGDLIAAQADLNKTDEQGKTALHWAAAVNNLDAAILLLQHGGLNRDAQDVKGQTPLFLAAKEGSYQVAQLLLYNSANSEIADQLDRLPRDVAMEKHHVNIVRLLDEYAIMNQNGAKNNTSEGMLCGGRMLGGGGIVGGIVPDVFNNRNGLAYGAMGYKGVVDGKMVEGGMKSKKKRRNDADKNNNYAYNKTNDNYKTKFTKFTLNPDDDHRHLSRQYPQSRLQPARHPSIHQTLHTIGSAGSSPNNSDFASGASPPEEPTNVPYCHGPLLNYLPANHPYPTDPIHPNRLLVGQERAQENVFVPSEHYVEALQFYAGDGGVGVNNNNNVDTIVGGNINTTTVVSGMVPFVNDGEDGLSYPQSMFQLRSFQQVAQQKQQQLQQQITLDEHIKQRFFLQQQQQNNNVNNNNQLYSFSKQIQSTQHQQNVIQQQNNTTQQQQNTSQKTALQQQTNLQQHQTTLSQQTSQQDINYSQHYLTPPSQNFSPNALMHPLPPLDQPPREPLFETPSPCSGDKWVDAAGGGGEGGGSDGGAIGDGGEVLDGMVTGRGAQKFGGAGDDEDGVNGVYRDGYNGGGDGGAFSYDGSMI